MKNKLFLTISIILLSSTATYCALPKVAVKPDILVQSSDGHPKILKADFIAQSSWIQEQVSMNPRMGNVKDRSSALPIRLDRKQLDSIEDLLKKQLEKKLADKEEYFAIEDLVPLGLEGLAELIRNTHYLGIKLLFYAAIEEFLSTIKTKHLLDFVRDASFITKFGFSEEILRQLGGARILDEDELRTVLSLLYTDLIGDRAARTVTLSPSGKYLLATGVSEDKSDSFCHVWDTRTHQRQLSLPSADLHESFESGSFCAGPDIVLQTNKAVRLLSPFGKNPHLDVKEESPFLQLNDEKLVYQLDPSNSSHIWGSCVSPNFTLIAAGVNDAILVRSLKDKESRLLRESVYNSNLDKGAHLIFTPDSKGLIEMRGNGAIRFWSIDYATPVACALNHSAPIGKWVITKKGTLITLDVTGKICEWELLSTDLGKLLKEHSYDGKGIKSALAFNEIGNRLALSNEHGGGRIYNVENNQFEEGALVSEDHFVEACYHSSDRPLLVTSTADHDLVVWNPETQEQLKKIVVGRPGNGLQFSSSGSFLVRPFLDGTIRLFHYAEKESEDFLRGKITLPQALLLKLLIAQNGLALPAIPNALLPHDNNSEVARLRPIETLEEQHLRDIVKGIDKRILQAFHVIDEGVHLSLSDILSAQDALKSNSAVQPCVQLVDSLEDIKPEKITGELQPIPKGAPGSGLKKLSNVGFSRYIRQDGAMFTAAGGAMYTTAGIVDKTWAVKDVNGFTLIHAAAQQNNKNLITRIFSPAFSSNLAQSGFTINEICNRGWTPLHLACAEGHVDMVKLLLSLGAKADRCTAVGFLPLHVAAQYGYAEIIDLLTNAPGSQELLNRGDNTGWTPLHHAAFRGQKEAAQILVKKGAAIYRKNFAGKTAYDLAIDDDVRNEVAIPKLTIAMQRSLNSEYFEAINKGLLGKVIDSLDKGADVNCENPRGGSYGALVFAAKRAIQTGDGFDLSIIRHLVSQGLKPSIKEKTKAIWEFENRNLYPKDSKELREVREYILSL